MKKIVMIVGLLSISLSTFAIVNGADSSNIKKIFIAEPTSNASEAISMSNIMAEKAGYSNCATKLTWSGQKYVITGDSTVRNDGYQASVECELQADNLYKSFIVNQCSNETQAIARAGLFASDSGYSEECETKHTWGHDFIATGRTNVSHGYGAIVKCKKAKEDTATPKIQVISCDERIKNQQGE